ncbi:MAG TPA: hypothetical protein DCZ91_15055 [Lachnospiraceae bacterium]|nr:hypothetical protein [Lachnospiraceae bacterium]
MNSNRKQNRHSASLKKNFVGLAGILMVMALTACSNEPEDSGAAQNMQTEPEVSEGTEQKVQTEPEVSGGTEQNMQTEPEVSEGTEQNMQTEPEVSEGTEQKVQTEQESAVDKQETADSERTAEELLDLFINGLIEAVDSADPASAFYISDLNMDSGEWDSFSIGEKVDLDNDGENELIINGPYGGMYLDARDNGVYKFAAGGGTAVTVSYTWYNGAVWIMYSNRSSAGFEFYHMEKYEGADNLTAEMNFGEEFNLDNAEAGIKYTLNKTEISHEEYTALCSKIFAAEVSTD